MPFHDKKSKEKYEELLLNRYMSFAGWEVRMMKNCDRGLENAAPGPLAEGSIFNLTNLIFFKT